jgi:hypothetical protein
VKLSELLLRALKANAGLQGALKAQRFAGAEPSGTWQGTRIAAFICPSADHISALEAASRSGSPSRVVLAVNPAWLSPSSAAAPSPFASLLEPVFSLTRHDICGQKVSVLRVYPGGWHVYSCSPGEPPRLLAVDHSRPSRASLSDLILQGSSTPPSSLSDSAHTVGFALPAPSPRHVPTLHNVPSSDGVRELPLSCGCNSSTNLDEIPPVLFVPSCSAAADFSWRNSDVDWIWGAGSGGRWAEASQHVTTGPVSVHPSALYPSSRANASFDNSLLQLPCAPSRSAPPPSPSLSHGVSTDLIGVSGLLRSFDSGGWDPLFHESQASQGMAGSDGEALSRLHVEWMTS